MPSSLSRFDQQQFEQRLRERRVALRMEIREPTWRATYRKSVTSKVRLDGFRTAHMVIV